MENIDMNDPWAKRVNSFEYSPNVAVAAVPEKYSEPTVYVLIYSNGGGTRTIKGVFKHYADAEKLEYKLRTAISKRSAFQRFWLVVQTRKESVFIETHIVQSYYKRRC